LSGLRVLSPQELVSLYREHERPLRAFLRARLADAGAVEDLCQEVFLAALARGVPEGDAGPWLFAIARNKVLKLVRDRKTAAPLVEESTSAERSGSLPDAPGPLLAASEAEERARVRSAVLALEAELREAILLTYEAGLDAPRIAALLDVPVTTVESRIKRGREALVVALVRASDPPRIKEVAT
jgi:RNA polymerase sigma-70 factor (ECF subfamily)